MARESAVVVCVPEAEPLVAEWRLRYDPSAARGVPAHITLLYPFVPPDELSADVDQKLDAEFASVAPFDITFHRASRFGDEILFLDPEPDEPFVEMIRRLSNRFGLVPYGGTIPVDRVKPHLTVVDGHKEVLDDVERRLIAQLPISCRLVEAWILVSDEEWRWTKLRPVAFGGK